MSSRCCIKELLRLFGSMRAGIVLLEYDICQTVGSKCSEKR